MISALFFDGNLK